MGGTNIANCLPGTPYRVFAMCGHACTKYSEETVIPSDCLYITTTMCGNWSDSFDDQMIRFDKYFSNKQSFKSNISFKTPKGSRLLKNPCSVANFKTLSAKFSTMTDSPFHLHLQGTNYNNSLFVPLLIWYVNEKKKIDVHRSNKPLMCVIRKSGLRELNNNILGELVIKSVGGREIVFGMKELRFLYGDSVYPTFENVIDDLHEQQYMDSVKNVCSLGSLEKVINKYKILQSELFELFPGIHYNVRCREPCDEESLNKLSSMQQTSDQMSKQILSQIENDS
jgi:hypothetical protein